MQNGEKREAIFPAVREVAHRYVRIGVGGHLRPFQQHLLGQFVLFVLNDVRNLEMQNDRPDEAKRQFRIAIHNVLGPYVN